MTLTALVAVVWAAVLVDTGPSPSRVATAPLEPAHLAAPFVPPPRLPEIGLAIRGVVTDVEGTPIAGALVAVWDAADGPPATRQTRSTNDGYFEIPAIAGWIQGEVRAAGHATRDLDLNLESGDGPWVDVALEPAVPLRGVVRSDGEPVAGVSVDVCLVGVDICEPREVVTDAGGWFAIDDLAAGRYRLSVHEPSYFQEHVVVDSGGADVVIELTRGGALAVVAELAGALCDEANGDGAAQIRVLLEYKVGDGWRPARRPRIAPGCEARRREVIEFVGLPAGRYRPRAVFRAVSALGPAVDLSPGERQAVSVVIAAGSRDLSGVVDVDLEPGWSVASWEVCAFIEHLELAGRCAVPDAAGRFAFAGIDASVGWVELHATVKHRDDGSMPARARARVDATDAEVALTLDQRALSGLSSCATH